MGAHAYSPSTWKAMVGGSRVQSQSGLHSKILFPPKQQKLKYRTQSEEAAREQPSGTSLVLCNLCSTMTVQASPSFGCSLGMDSACYRMKTLVGRGMHRSTEPTQKPGHLPVTPALRRQRQLDLCELEASLIYITNSRPLRTI